MTLHYSKKELYQKVEELKCLFEISEYSYGISLIKILQEKNYSIKSIPFKTKGLRGMAVIGNDNQSDIILLNTKRTFCEQNFDCGHELIHLTLHRNLERNTFNCFEEVGSYQDKYIEWQANEGAAEFFVPYKILLPIIKENYPFLITHSDVKFFKTKLAKLFNVPEIVITYRIENLKYEIYQYISGTSIKSLKILSAKKQEEKKIYTKSLNDI